MKLYKVIASQTAFSLIQQLSKLVLSTIINIIVIRNLDRDAYGLIGIATGYFVIVNLFLISPQNVLLKDFQKHSKEKLSLFISNSLSFSFWRNIALLSISAIIGIFLSIQQNNWSLLWIFILFYIAQSIINLIGETQFFLKILFLQKKLTLLAIIATVVRIFLLAGLFFDNHILTYLLLLILSEVIELILSLYLLHQNSKLRLVMPLESIKEARDPLKSFSIWHHIIANLTSFIYRVDTVFLSYFVSLEVIGDYNVALQLANFSFIVPSLLQSSTGLALTRQSDEKEVNHTVTVFLKYSLITSLGQLIVFFLLGRFYIGLHTDTNVDQIYIYSILIFIGTTIINIGRPLISFIYNRTELKSFLFRALVPTTAFTLIAYLLSAATAGAIGIAGANIAAYSFWLVSMYLYSRENGFKLSGRLVEKAELELLKKLFPFLQPKQQKR